MSILNKLVNIKSVEMDILSDSMLDVIFVDDVLKNYYSGVYNSIGVMMLLYKTMRSVRSGNSIFNVNSSIDNILNK